MYRKRMPFVISGFSREFLEKYLGLKEMKFPLFDVCKEPVMPLEPIRLRCFEQRIEINNCGVEQSDSSAGS